MLKVRILVTFFLNLVGVYFLSAQAQPKKTYLDCLVVTNYFIAPHNKHEYRSRFGLEIEEDVKSMSIISDSDEAGAYIIFTSKSVGPSYSRFTGIRNVGNHSSESEINIAWDRYNPTGELSASYTLRLSRFTGSIKFDIAKFLSSSGSCDVIKSRKF